MTDRTIAIIQARMGSSRLPGKVLLDIAGKPMLARVAERTCLAQRVDELVIATTTDPGDDPVEAFCQQNGYLVYRGSPQDVLDRYYQAALRFNAGTVVRITADCPLIDPHIIDQTVVAREEASADFAANRLPPPFHRTYPIGLDTEVCTFAALERAWREAKAPYQREHVLPYLYDTPGRFRTVVIHTSPDYGHLRWTVDTVEDLEVVRQVYARFNGRTDFTYPELIELFTRDPNLTTINAGVRHKSMTETDERIS